MGRADYFKLGSWNAICDRCGAKFKAEDLKLTWQGLRVCARDFETRHPQDFVRGVPERMPVPWSRPNTALHAPPAGPCTPEGIQALASQAVADCAICDFVS